MSEILIDGYNLIRQSERFAEQERRGGLEAGRTALIRALATWRRATGDRVVVVFDGDEGIGFVPGASRQEGVAVIFSRPPDSADDVIEAHVRKRHGKKAVLVVSSDRRILDAARRERVAAMKAEDFEAEMARGTSGGPGGPGGRLKPEADEAEVAYWEKAFRTKKGMFEEKE